MRAPYRVIVWGPGGVGSIAIREISRSPAFELVGVRAYSKAKVGLDAGTLIGIEALGVRATDDVDALLKLKCDCVLYTARGYLDTDAEVLKILAAGRNIVTPLPYHQAPLFRDPLLVRHITDACAEGNSVFHATGLDPDLISERVVLALTGLCTDITQLSIDEIWDGSFSPPELNAAAGFGQSIDEARRLAASAPVSSRYLNAICHSMSQALGVAFERIEETHDFGLAPHDIRGGETQVRAGTVGRLSHGIRGYVHAGDADPFFTMQYNWVIGAAMRPAGIAPDQYYVVNIEGRPSLRMALDIRPSLHAAERICTIGGRQIEPGYHAIVAPCLQAIPLVCEAAAGILPSIRPPIHWMKDLRGLGRSGTLPTP